VVQRIVEGLTPIQRARFVFQGPSNSFQGLEQLIMVDRNLTFADQIREQSVATSSAEIVLMSHDVKPNSSHNRTSKRPTQGKLPVCHHCGKVGHIQRNFYARNNSRRSSVRVVSTRS
jgi:hypothetical protein